MLPLEEGVQPSPLGRWVKLAFQKGVHPETFSRCWGHAWPLVGV